MAIGSEIHSATFAVPTFPVRKFSVAEYCGMAEADVLTEDDRVELLEGWIVPMMTRGPRHDTVVCILQQMLFELSPSEWSARGQSAVTTTDSVPEPDVAIVRGAPRDYLEHHPGVGDIECAFEVADSSLSRDREKSRIYARAGIPVYWIVNLVDNRVEVYSEPDQDSAEYKQSANYGKGSAVPLVIFGKTLADFSVDELLP